MRRAQHIRALMEGELDPSVDAAALLVLDLSDPTMIGTDGERLLAILRSIPTAPPDPRRPPVLSFDELSPPEAFEAAYGAFLRLSAERRTEVLESHAQKRAAVLLAAQQQQRDATTLATVRQHAQELEAYLEGTLDGSVDPTPLLRVNMADVDELALSSARRMTWLDPAAAPASDSAPDPAPDPAPEGSSSTALAEARARLDALRLRFVRLTDDQRARLRVAHQERVTASTVAEGPSELKPTQEEATTAQEISEAASEAEEAAVAQQAALEAARLAKTEAKRIVAEERARLLGVKQAQALYEIELNRRRASRDEHHDKALEWSRRVSELARSLKFASEKARDADPMYEELRIELAAMRERLRAELARVRGAGADVPATGDGLDRDLPTDVDRGDLIALRAELVANERRLAELEQTVAWELAQGLRDDVVLLNRTRLSLLELASHRLSASVTGFGSGGIDQVQRELDQISVELGFHALKLSRYRRSIIARFQGSTIPLLIGTAQFLLALVVYLWWRRRGGDVLVQLEQYLREQRPSTRLHRMGSTLAWYLRRIRQPLELLLVLWILFGLIGEMREFPELNLLWITARWVLLGLAVILFVDALAARQALYSTAAHDTSPLRIHSLRLVGLNVIAVGLVLSLTSAMVGRGAIYSWVISTCWILSFPVALYLVHRWRPIIFERIEQEADQGPFTRWVTSNKNGLASFPAATAAAAYLLVMGLTSWAMRQLSGLEATRRLLAYLFRREVARQAAATEADGRFVPIAPEVYATFDPERSPSEQLGHVARAQLDRVVELLTSPRSTLSAVVGERGVGKSMFLRRVMVEIGEDKVRVLSCPEAGFEALMAQLAALTDEPDLRGEPLCAALRQLGPLVIAIDDIQRLVVPAVNGLRELDAFTKLARDVGGQVSWVVAIGSASWHYVRRARGDSVFFEQVVTLPHWSEEQLGELIRAQCARANIEPSFDGLVVPRQAEAPLPNQGNRTEAGYYRLLWDFSRGNPAVALHAFRESLFVTPNGEVVVRLFKEPPPEQIEDLSMPILFVLRTVVQLEMAATHEVAAATQLPTSDIEDAFRFCLARGYFESVAGNVRLTWPWYRTITTVLQRQHLLSAL